MSDKGGPGGQRMRRSRSAKKFQTYHMVNAKVLKKSRSDFLFSHHNKGICVHRNPKDQEFGGYTSFLMENGGLDSKPRPLNRGNMSMQERFKDGNKQKAAMPGPKYMPKYLAHKTSKSWSFGGGQMNARDGFVFSEINGQNGLLSVGTHRPASGIVGPGKYDVEASKKSWKKRPSTSLFSRSQQERFKTPNRVRSPRPGPKYRPKLRKNKTGPSWGPKPAPKAESQPIIIDPDQLLEGTQEDRDAKQNAKLEEEMSKKKDINPARTEALLNGKYKPRSTFARRAPLGMSFGKKLDSKGTGLSSPGPKYHIGTANWKLNNKVYQLGRVSRAWR